MSGICAFFGHRDVIITQDLEQKLRQTVLELIKQGYDEFWCCEQGNFDWLSRLVMQDIKKEYAHIYLCYICPYNPDKYSQIRQKSLEERYEIIYPPVASNGPPRFAIIRRNRYIAENADTIICYITHQSGGAYTALKIAKKTKEKNYQSGILIK